MLPERFTSKIDLVAVLRDDHLIDAIARGHDTSPDPAAVLLAAWKTGIDATPLPAWPALDAVAAVASGRRRDSWQRVLVAVALWPWRPLGKRGA